MLTTYFTCRSRFRTDFIVSGVAPFQEDILLLAYVSEDSAEKKERDEAQLPELRIFDKNGEELSADALTMKGYEYYQANDYILDYGEGLYYAVCPKDVVLGKPRDLDDHLAWLLDHKKYLEAYEEARKAETKGNVSKSGGFTKKVIGEILLNDLIEKRTQHWP
jgi:hypothetical protein